MDPKEKAKEIYFAMLNAGKGFTSDYLAKECAMIAVEEINYTLSKLEPKVHENGYWLYRELKATIPYWKKVKQELKKL